MIHITNMATHDIFFLHNFLYHYTINCSEPINWMHIFFFFCLFECEEYLLTPDYFNVYKYFCDNQSYVFCLNDLISTNVFPLSCFIKCCYTHTHSHCDTHNSKGITAINISGEQLIYNS